MSAPATASADKPAEAAAAASALSGKVFSLAGRGLKLTSRDDIAPHLAELADVTDLEEVHFGGNTLGVEACQAIAEVLSRNRGLKVADFADIFTGRLITEIPDALRALCDSLVGHESLVELNLSDNAFGGRSAEPMVNFLRNNHHFSVLKLNNNGLGIQGGRIVADALYEAAVALKEQGKPSQLRTVICGRNRLENGSAPAWARAYAAHGALTEVRMFQNGIRMDGIAAISSGLAQCPTLEVLDLMDNTATLKGSRALAACLPKWSALRELNLNDCLLRPKGAQLVFAALAKGANAKLRKLQVAYCEIDRAGLQALGKAIESSLGGLEALEINGNWADEDDECIEAVKAGLAKWGHEEALDELDELDPDGELESDEEDESAEEEGEESDEEAEDKEAEAKADKVEAAEAPKTDAAIEEKAAAAVAVPAASAATLSAALAGLTVGNGEADGSKTAAAETAPKDDDKGEAAAQAEPSVTEAAPPAAAQSAASPAPEAKETSPAPEAAKEAAEPAETVVEQAGAQPSSSKAQQEPELTAEPPVTSQDASPSAESAAAPRPAAAAGSVSKKWSGKAGHGRTSSVDLCGELYPPSGEATAAAAKEAGKAEGSTAATASASGSAQGGATTEAPAAATAAPTPRKNRFRAAFGAVRELLR